jgi:hypothetical protein
MVFHESVDYNSSWDLSCKQNTTYKRVWPIILPFVVTAIMIFVMVAFRILSERFVLSNIISITLEIALGVITYSFTMAFLIKTKKIILR